MFQGGADLFNITKLHFFIFIDGGLLSLNVELNLTIVSIIDESKETFSNK